MNSFDKLARILIRLRFILVLLTLAASCPCVTLAQGTTGPPNNDTCSFTPTGVIAQRWQLTGGVSGPMGCAVSAAQPAPGGSNGQIMQFQNGQVVSSPNQGTNMAVAVYQQGANLIVDWGDSSPYNYDRFIVRWTIDGTNSNQADVPPEPYYQNYDSYIIDRHHRTRGIWSVPLPVAGTYSISVEGCDPATFGSSCKQGWTVPATITYVPPPPPTGSEGECLKIPDGLIKGRWLTLGGVAGPLGCPVSQPTSVAGSRGQVVSFENGQIGWAPEQGTNMVVAAYQVENDVAVEWGPTDPFSYDKFNVLWNKDGQKITQNEIDKPAYILTDFNHGIDRVRGVGPGAYTVSVEGCDNGALGSTCRQGFTFPLTVQLQLATEYNTNCPFYQYDIKGLIGQRWSSLVGPAGPLLGCPTGPEQAVANGRAQTFERGQIVTSPQQGPGLTVAFYQVNSQQLQLSWGDTFPFTYDKFIVRVNGQQIDVSSSSGGTIIYPYQPNSPPLTPNTVYTAIIEGCDVSSIGGSTCRQGWTVPVSVTTAAIFPNPPDQSTIDFSHLTPASTPADAATQIDKRGLAISQYNACRKTLGAVFKDEEDFMDGAIAKLDLVSRGVYYCRPPYLVRPVDLLSEVNSALRFQQIQSSTGSSSDKRICIRTGEYDIALTGYITILYKYGALLDNDVRYHILNDLLDANGPMPLDELIYCSVAPETENHLNGIVSARYLTNQLLYAEGGDPWFDNESNGMNDYILARLQQFLQHDFIEYNSKPYQTYSINAIQNLYDYAIDRRVKVGAWLVLDYISAKYAASSNFLRRNAPYRRRISQYSTNLLDGKADPNNSRFTLLTGMFQINEEFVPKLHLDRGYSEDAQMVAVSSYRPSEALLGLIMNQPQRSFYQRIHHDGVEIYSSQPDYLITAGGYWTDTPYKAAGVVGDSDDDGAVVPTTLMPSDHITNVTNLIRIEGRSNDVDDHERLNTCVAPDFACGQNVRIPDDYMTAARKGNGCFVMQSSQTVTGAQWLFIDSSDTGCNNDELGALRPYGFYLAAFVSGELGGDNWGFFEAHPRDPKLSFAQFQKGVLQRNANNYYGNAAFGTDSNSYTMASGKTVRFTIPKDGANKYDWTILSTGDAQLDALGTDISNWPLASGDILNSNGNNGQVTVSNPKTGQHIYLDFSDVGEPKRTEMSFGPIHP